MYNNLRELCSISAVSGDEKNLRDKIISKIEGYCEYNVDNLGNIIAFKKGKNKPKNKVMISAHMDEVGMIVTRVSKDGKIKFDSVGGIDRRILLGRKVLIGDKNIIGIIGSKAFHIQSASEKDRSIPISELYVDIGLTDKEEALKLINMGDSISFIGDYIEYGKGFIRAKAIDDRFGCCLMIELIKLELEYDCYFTFVVQEEVGLRGSTVASYTVAPDIAVVFEATTACDLPDISDHKKVCNLGGGPVVSFMDKHTIYDKNLYNLAFDIARSNNILCQTKSSISGGNDSGAIHLSKSGVRILAISIPCRYLHSSSCVAKKTDIDNAFLLSKILLSRLFEI